MTVPPAAPSDEHARRRICEDLDATFFVEAAAGTGKTQALIGRIVALLAAGRARLDAIVAVTFTEKAAGEMKLRLRTEIEEARGAAADAVRPLLDAAIAQLELARVGTIHAFCADLLRERPIEAGIDPLFEVAPEDESQRLLDRAFDGWFAGVLEDPPPGVRRVLRRRSRFVRGTTARESLRGAAGVLAEHRDFPAPWRREPFDRAAAIDALLAALADVGALTGRASRADDYLAQSTGDIQRFVAENRLREDVRGRDYDALEAELRDLARLRTWRYRGSPQRPFGADLPRDEVIARRDAVKQQLDELLLAAEADLAPLLQAELAPVIEAYTELKRRRGVLDFLDLLVRARDLLRDDALVRRDVQERFTHYFVDEFQDTDPLQAEILLLLAGDGDADSTARPLSHPGESRGPDGMPPPPRLDPGFRRDDLSVADDVSFAGDGAARPGKLFFVGDPKQSIYRFRRADVAVYERVKRELCARGAEVLHLQTSFRAVQPLQELVNACFARAMDDGRAAGGDSQAAYVALQPARAGRADQPAIVALPVPDPYADWGKITQWSIEKSFPEAVGAFVDWLVRESGWKVEENGAEVPVQARHVCILFRRFKSFRDDMTRDYVRALETRQIPHVLVGGRSFHDREEVLAIRNALTAIEWPEDELRVFATLRGPFFALADDDLLSFRGLVGRLHPLRRFDRDQLAGGEAQVAEALAVLAELHFARNQRPIADTVARLLAAVRAHAGIAIWPTGEQALANCLRTLDMARRFERGGARSFRAFVERLEDDAERGVAEEAPAVEEGTEGVRVMTVHRAKGLEFPVVVLADPTCKLAREVPSRHVDPQRGLWAEPLCGCAPLDLLDAVDDELRRDRDEGVRIAYVAATRARDLLVVPAIGDAGAESDGWLAVLDLGIYPAEENRRGAVAAPGCPAFGVDSVRQRPSDSPGAIGAVAPGLHRPALGEHGVVWWDPNLLDLDREADVGLRQQSILEADEQNVAVASGARAHAAWQEGHRAALAAGAAPSSLPVPVVELAAGDVATDDRSVELIDLGASRAAAGALFGSLVHAVLAVVPLAADLAEIEALLRLHAVLLGVDAEVAAGAAPRIAAALAHPLLRRAAESTERGDLRREVPVTWRAGAVIAEGVVDLAFRDDGAWIVVDFKTDADLTMRRADYERQVRLYCAGIEAATGLSARGVLLWV